MEGGIYPVTWRIALVGRPVLTKLRSDGPLRAGTIYKLGRKCCVLDINGKRVRRPYGQFFYMPQKTDTIIPKWRGK